MTLKLYGYPIAPCTYRVAMTLIEKQVPFELVVVDLTKGESKTPEFRQKQPFGQVPYIDDDGFILYESRAICRYIAAKYAHQGTSLIPNEEKAHALFEQAASIEVTTFDPPVSAAFGEMIIKPFFGKVPDKDVFAGHIAALSAKLDAYEVILGKQKYLAGDEFTLADLLHIPSGTSLRTAGSEIMAEKPNVARWFADITSRPSWLAVKDGVKSTA